MANSNPLKAWMERNGETAEAYEARKQAAFDAVRNQYIPKIEERNKREAEQRERNTYIPAQFGQRMLESQNRRRYENTYVPASLAENALHGETDGEDYLSYSNARLRGEYLARADTASLQAELDALERSIEEERKQYNRAKMRLASYGNNTGTSATRAEQRYIDTYEQKQAQAETLRRDIRDAGALQAEIARQSQQIANEKRYRNTYIPASLAQDAIHRSGNGADFNAYADARLRGEYISHVDTAKLQSELDALERSIEQERKQYNRAKLRLASYGNNVGTTAARADQRYIDAYEQKQARAQALRRDISDAESIQKAAEYNALRGRSDFAEKSKPAGTKIATFNLLDPSTWAAGDDKYDFINNIGGYKNTVRGLARADGAATEYGAYSSLARMTQDEIATYNYIYATEGKEAADEYLDFLEDELNYRQGQAEAALVEGSLLRSVGYSMGAGIRRFGDNIGDMFAGEVSAIRPYEYGTQIARENLADTGAQLPEWMGGASVGQVLFDAAGTAGNILPSILLSTLTAGAGAAGAAAMGLSTGGGARMQAMREGYTPEQATMYGILVGASESSLQYLLGGMSKLGGKLTGGAAAKAIQNIDHALLRIATSGTIKMAGEGAEEYLQEILDPIYRNLLLGENNQIDLTDPNAVYSFMLGALTAGVMDMPQIVSDGRTRTPSLQNSASAADASSATIPGRNNIDLVPSGNTHTDPASVGSGSISQGLSTNIIPETGEKGNRANGENGVKTEPYAYRDPATGMPMVGERAIAESAPLDVGAATHIKNPYTGRTPVQSQDVQRAEVDIPYEKVADARERMREAATNRGEKSFASTLRSIYKTLLEGRFAGQVEIPGVTFNDAPYVATIHNSVIGKVISDPGMSAEKLSVLENLRSVVANAEYVGSGKAVGKDDHIIRYDYFESRVRIDGQKYITRIDVEARSDSNNRVRTYRIDNIDLVPIEEALPGPTPGGIFYQEQGLFTNSISEKGEKSNHADAGNLKKEKDTPAPFETETAKSGTSGATIPGENNIDLTPLSNSSPALKLNDIALGTFLDPTSRGFHQQEQGLFNNTIPETGEKGNRADAENLKNDSSKRNNAEITEHLRNLKQDVATIELNPERIRTDADMEAIARKDITQYTADDIYTIVSALESKKGLYLKDLSRVLDAVSGENRNLHQALHNLIEADYNRALGEHGRMQSSDLESLRDRYKQRGIEGGSKESAAVMKFGQGYYIDRDGTRIDYTLDDLKKEFPDRWQDIAKTAEEDRALYDSYIDRINAMREQIYPEAMKQAQAELENTKAALASYDQKAARLNETIQGVQSKIDAYREKLAAKKRTDTAAYEKLKNGISYQERRLNRAMQELEKTMQRAADARFKASRLEDEIKNGEPLHQRKIERKQDYYHHVYASNLGIDLMTLIGAKNAASDMVAGRYTGEAGGAVGNFIDRMLGSIFGSKEISPGMVGVSDNTSPRVKWQGIMEHQKGGPYKLDAYESMADYIGMADYMLAFDAYTSQLRDITNLLQSAADRLDKTVGKSARNANSFIEWMKDWNDMLTGKTLPLDRGIQKVVGRNVMNGIRKLNSAAKSSTLLGNFRSMFVQGSAMANAMNYIPNPLDWINGARYMANAMSGKDGYADAINQSDFLAQRNMLTPNDIVKGGFLREAKKPLGKMLNVFQNAVDRLTWWTAYAQYDAASQTQGRLDKLNRSFTRAYDDAIDYADDITRRSVAGRGVGEQPMTVKSTFVDTFAPFQTEVLNTYNAIKENIHALISKDATKEQKSRAAAGLLAYEVSAFAINLIMNAMFGEDVVGFDFIGALTGALANDDDEDEDATANRIYEGVAGATLSGIPFASFATPLIMDQETAQALFGEDADPSRYGTGTMGTNAAADIVKTFFFDKNADGWDKLNAVSAFFPLGGKQIARTAQGIATVAQGGSYTQDAEGNERLQYRTDQGPMDYLQAGIFGKWSLPEARAYVEAGFPTLSAAHTAAYKNAVASGVDGAHFLVLLDRYKALEPIKNEAGKTEQSTKQQFREMLFRDSSLTNEQKTQMDRDLLCTEGQSPADYSSKSRFELSNHSPSAYERFEENIAGGMSEEEAFQLEDWANRFAGIQSYTDERGNYVGPQEQKRRMLFADETLTADEKEQIDRALIMGDGENARPADYSAKAMFDLFMQSESGYDNVIGATRKGIPEALALKVETWRQNQIARGNFSKDGYVDYMRGLGMSTSQINIILAETNKSWKPIE